MNRAVRTTIFLGCSSWHSAALLDPSAPTPLVLSRGCLCPSSSSSSSCRGRVNRPVRSPRISVGQECTVALDTTVGAGGSGGGAAAEQVLGEEIMWCHILCVFWLGGHLSGGQRLVLTLALYLLSGVFCSLRGNQSWCFAQKQHSKQTPARQWQRRSVGVFVLLPWADMSHDTSSSSM